MEILETNISNNGHWYPNVRVQASVLDWDDDSLPELVREGVDLIMCVTSLLFILPRTSQKSSTRMADVTYNTSSFPSLIRTLDRLSRLRDSRPTVLLAYKERDPDERRLWDMASEIELAFERVAEVPGYGGMPVEIYIGTFAASSRSRAPS